MTREEWIEWRKKEDEFHATPIGKAFRRFYNAALALEQNDDTTSVKKMKQRDEEFRDAGSALKEEIRKLLCAQPSPTEQPDATHA